MPDSPIDQESLVAMLQREFLSLHKKIESSAQQTTDELRKEMNQRFDAVTEALEDQSSQLASIDQKLDGEIRERDRVQQILDDHTQQLIELRGKTV